LFVFVEDCSITNIQLIIWNVPNDYNKDSLSTWKSDAFFM